MSRIIIFLVSIIFLNGCSLNKNSKFWTDSKNIIEENNLNYEEIFVKEKSLGSELNSNVLINLSNNINNNFSIQNYFNNNGRLNYDGELKKSSRYKFSKIKRFHQFEPTISFVDKNLIFFD